jgi:hypothetical protein
MQQIETLSAQLVCVRIAVHCTAAAMVMLTRVCLQRLAQQCVDTLSEEVDHAFVGRARSICCSVMRPECAR